MNSNSLSDRLKINRVSKIFNILRDVVESAEPASNKGVRIVSAVVFKNEIISIGTAKAKSHPLQKRFQKSQHNISLHAEIDAIQKALNRIGEDKMRKCEIFIIRVKKNDDSKYEYGNAKPCSGCEDAIAHFKLKNCYWSTDSSYGKSIFWKSN